MSIDPRDVAITDEQADAIRNWLEANAKAPGWLDGYALGASYIDTRVKSGANKDGRQAYVDLDHATAEKVPQLRGRSAGSIREYLEVRVELEAPSAPGMD